MTHYSNRFPRGRLDPIRVDFYDPDRPFVPHFLKDSPVLTDYATGDCRNAMNLTRLNRPRRTIGYHTYQISDDPRRITRMGDGEPR